jgi:hypothetical protein
MVSSVWKGFVITTGFSKCPLNNIMLKRDPPNTRCAIGVGDIADRHNNPHKKYISQKIQAESLHSSNAITIHLRNIHHKNYLAHYQNHLAHYQNHLACIIPLTIFLNQLGRWASRVGQRAADGGVEDTPGGLAGGRHRVDVAGGYSLGASGGSVRCRRQWCQVWDLVAASDAGSGVPLGETEEMGACGE